MVLAGAAGSTQLPKRGVAGRWWPGREDAEASRSRPPACEANRRLRPWNERHCEGRAGSVASAGGRPKPLRIRRPQPDIGDTDSESLWAPRAEVPGLERSVQRQRESSGRQAPGSGVPVGFPAPQRVRKRQTRMRRCVNEKRATDLSLGRGSEPRSGLPVPRTPGSTPASRRPQGPSAQGAGRHGRFPGGAGRLRPAPRLGAARACRPLLFPGRRARTQSHFGPK